MPETTASNRLGLNSSPVGCNTTTTPINPTTTPAPMSESNLSPNKLGERIATTKGEIKSRVSALGIGLDLMAAKKKSVARVNINPLINWRTRLSGTLFQLTCCHNMIGTNQQA